MKRRQGTIRRRGSAWEIKFEYRPREGSKRFTRYVTVKGTRQDAQRALTKLLGAADAGTLPDPCNMTVSDYGHTWLRGAHHIAPKTKERYGELLERQILPFLGTTKLQALKPEAVRTWHSILLQGGLSARTVGHAHRLLSRVLKDAVEAGTLVRNAAAIIKPPRIEEKEVEVLEPDQLAALMAGLEGHPLHSIATLAVASGLRRGELCGLQWTDIDFDRGVLRVERSVEETRQGLRVKPPKTRRGRRNVGLPVETTAMLREHYKAQCELRLKLGQGGKPVLVFSDIEGNMLSPDNLSRDWRRVCNARKLPRISFHALRHCHASLLLAAGVPVLTVSRRLGHAKASQTLDIYAHLLPGADADAARAIEGMLK